VKVLAMATERAQPP